MGVGFSARNTVVVAPTHYKSPIPVDTGSSNNILVFFLISHTL